MDEKFKSDLPKRLAETFGDETQEVTSKRLMITQGNISKWLTGQQTPTTETLYQIAKIYTVSVDWLLGLSEVKEIDGIAFDKITYEQAFIFIDRLMKGNNISLANLAEIIGKNEETDYDFGDEDAEEEDNSFSQEVLTERYDPDYIKIKDRLLSYLFRLRYKTAGVSEDIMEMWKEKEIPNFRRLQLVDNTGNITEALDAKGWAQFKAGDWIDTMEQLRNMTEEERQHFIDKIKKEKEGDQNDR